MVGGAEGSGQSGGAQAVPAEVEEVVVGSHPARAEELGEQVGDLAFERCGGLGACGAVGRDVAGRGQGGAVELAVRGERQLVDEHQAGGDQVGGQPRAQGPAQPVGERLPVPGRGGAGVGGGGPDGGGSGGGAGCGGPGAGGEVVPVRGACDDVADQAGVPVRGGHGGDGGGGHAVRGEQRGLDLGGFDAVAPDLQLVVRPCQVVEFPVRCPPGQVARAVEPGAGRTEGVGDEPGRGQAGLPQVAPGDAWAAHVQFAGDTGGHRAQAVVEQVEPGPGQWGPDRAAVAVGVPGGQVAAGGVDRGLGDPVQVDQGGRGRPAVAPVPVAQGPRTQRFSPEHDPAQGESAAARRVLGVGAVQGGEGGRGLAEHGDALAGQEVEEGPGRAGHVVRDHDEPPAVRQRSPHLPHGEVEGTGVEERPHVARSEAEGGGGVREKGHRARVGDDDALGPAGRAGGVDDVGGVGGQQRSDPVVVVEGGGRVRGPGQRGRFAGRQDVDRAGVGQDEFGALVRPFRVEGDEGRSGRGHGEDRGHQVDGARQPDGDRAAGSRTAPDQGPGQAVGARGEFAVGEGGGGVLDGDGVGEAGRGTGEEVRERDGPGAGAGAGARGGGAGRRAAALGGGKGVAVTEGAVLAGGQPVQQPDVTAGLGGRLGGAVPARVGVQVDAQAPVSVVRVHGDGQVLDGTDGDVAHRRRAAREVSAVAEGQDVHGQSVQRAARAGRAEVGELVLVPVAPVREDGRHLVRHRAHQCAGRPVRVDGDAQREDVRGGAGGQERHVPVAGRYRQAQYHLRGGARPGPDVREQCPGGRGQHRPVHVEAPGGRPQPGEPSGGQAGAAARGDSSGGGGADRVRAGEPGAPERAVGLEPGRGAVGAFGGGQRVQRVHGGRRALPALQRRVEPTDPPDQQGAAQTVKDQVVAGQVPAVPLVGQP